MNSSGLGLPLEELAHQKSAYEKCARTMTRRVFILFVVGMLGGVALPATSAKGTGEAITAYTFLVVLSMTFGFSLIRLVQYKNLVTGLEVKIHLTSMYRYQEAFQPTADLPRSAASHQTIRSTIIE